MAGSRTRPGSPAFARAVSELARMVWRPELRVAEIDSPQRIAPQAAAISAEVIAWGDQIGNGRLILLHDPAGNPAWSGEFRCVTFAKAELDPGMVRDEELPEVCWAWLTEALESNGADAEASAGTVTVSTSLGFGAIAGPKERAEIELRASWSPTLDQGRGLGAHLSAWQDLLCQLSGLPPRLGLASMPAIRRPAR